MSEHNAPIEKRKTLGLTGHFNLRRFREANPRPERPKPLHGAGFDAHLFGALAALAAMRPARGRAK